MKVIYFLLILMQLSHVSSAVAIPCDLRETKYGSVCVCTANHCDYLDVPEVTHDNDIVIISSSKAGLRFSTSRGSFIKESETESQNFENLTNFNIDTVLVEQNGRSLVKLFGTGFDYIAAKPIKIEVNRQRQYQKIVSWGGAFTGSVSYLLQQMDQALQDHIYRSYFGTSGIQYNTIRTPIGGCDFDIEPWAYNESPRDDPQLSNFTELLARDLKKVQQLQRLKSITELEELKIMAAAWSSPTWMKSNERWTGFSQLKTEYYQTWADYHLKFLELMNAKNMPIWAITTGNEPLNGVIGWFFVHFMSLGWTPRNQAIWLSEHLGPTIRNSKFKNVLIFGNDDQRYTYPAWFRKMRSARPEALKYLDGLAVHWYWDDVFGPELIDIAHNDMPDKLILNTESCIGDKPWQTHGPELGSWTRGEQYVRAYMQDLKHAFNGWIDWNLLLNETGGPNYVGNHVDAPIILNTTNYSEFYKQPLFYAIGHFTKFITPGSVRIELLISSFDLDAVAFQRADGQIVVVIYNGANTASSIALNDSVRGNFMLNIPGRSWHSIIYK